MVADEVGVEVLHPGEGAEVNGQTKNGDVVSVQDGVAEAVCLPESNGFSGVTYYLLDHKFISLGFRIS